jgi:hypothetical protein
VFEKGETGNDMSRFNPSAGAYVIGRDNGAVQLTGVVTETILGFFIVAGNIMGANGWIEIETLWTCNNNVNAKTARIRLATLANPAFLSSSLASAVGGFFQSLITNNHAANSQIGGNIGGGHGAASVALPTDTIDTTNTFVVLITGQLANGGDNMTLNHFSAVISPSD